MSNQELTKRFQAVEGMVRSLRDKCGQNLPEQLLDDVTAELLRIRHDLDAVWKGQQDLQRQVHQSSEKILQSNRQLERELEWRQVVENALTESEQKYRAIFENSPAGIAHFDRTGKITAVNHALPQLLGRTREDLMGLCVSERIRDPQMRAAYDECMAGRTGHWEGWHKPGSGDKARYWRVKFAPVFADTGELAGGTAIMEDATAAKQAQEDLEASEQRFRLLFDRGPDPYVLADSEGRLVDVNRAVVDMSGYPREELVGRLFHELDVLPAPQAQQARRLLGVTRDRTAAETREFTIQRRDGRRRIIEANAFPVALDGQTLYLVTARDVTERRQTEQALRRRTEELARSNAELQKFAYVASHDLQEPLRTITSFVQLLEIRYKEKLGPEADQYIQLVVDSALRLQRLIRDLLDFSRVHTRGKPFLPTAAGPVLKRAVENLEERIRDAGARITADELPVVVCDEAQLLQLFQHLIDNAIKFRGERPPAIHIWARRQENQWLFCVRDNGIGIPAEYADRVFVIFQRLHTRQDYPGTGIGLAICKKIIERHHGRIWFESVPGQETTFCFTVPDHQQYATLC
ncbi:MAG: PAS domain S-box protein [Phycisphaerae bacterium]|nr:PAS domain S-box protein [Phycisphaerae bacterium]